ncbi:MAG TPA: type II toxin-antitoxin system RelE/ParE family toxin [Nitrospirae bacterium]|nr:type II toxin-antitoxin system RelE/ParE family toxin [Nitrospirota bacterium]
MVNYLLSAIARQDIISIRDYTMDTWGEEQVSTYLSQLEQRFEWLAQNPRSGKKRDDVKEGYRSFQEGRHVIFYRISEVGIEVIGIPHQSEDIEHHLNK